jgi:hypothetical protein
MALKVEEKLQRQLQKEEKRRLVKQRKAQRVQDKEQRQEAEVRKLAAKEAKEARQAECQLKNSIKQARQSKRNQNNTRLATEEVDLEAAGSAEAQLAPPADARPRRQKKLPVKL